MGRRPPFMPEPASRPWRCLDWWCDARG